MALYRRSTTHSLSTEQVIARLARRPEVAGVVMMGSGGAGQLSPASDIDLLVVLNTEQRPGLISTTIDDRLAEVYFALVPELDSWLAARSSLPQESEAAVRLRWLEDGQILFDRAGKLAQAQAALRAAPWGQAPDDAEIYSAWFRTNYDLVQTARLVTAPDEASRLKADLRLARMLVELWEHYFLLRRLPAMSEKGRARWMLAEEPRFLAAYRACLGEPERLKKFEQFVELARETLQPAGGLWPADAAAAEANGGAQEAAEALGMWEGWLAED
jgi:predicted nucleotidyltransferase